MNTQAPPSGSSATATERVEMRTLRERRRRVRRSLLLILLAISVMVVLTIMNRDEAAIDSCWKRMQALRDVLQEACDSGQPSPPLLPPVPNSGEAGERWRQLLRFDHNRYNVLFDPERVAGRRELGVGCCREPHARVLVRSGRHVLIFDAQRRLYAVRWMSEQEFQRRAEELGLRVPGQR